MDNEALELNRIFSGITFKDEYSYKLLCFYLDKYAKSSRIRPIMHIEDTEKRQLAFNKLDLQSKIRFLNYILDKYEELYANGLNWVTITDYERYKKLKNAESINKEYEGLSKLAKVLINGEIIDIISKYSCQIVSKQEYLYALRQGLKERPNFTFCLNDRGYSLTLGSTSCLCEACFINKAEASYIINKDVVLILSNASNKSLKVENLSDITRVFKEN